MMKLGKMFVGLCFGSVFAVGCSTSDVPGGDPHEQAEGAREADEATAPAADTALRVTDARVRLERAERALDRGEVKGPLADLQALASDSAVSGDDRDAVLLALSRAYELFGDDDGAVEAVENLLSARAGRDRSDTVEVAEKRLRFLLTGEAEESGLRLPSNGSPPPIASALAELFEAGEDGRILVDVYAFGRRRANDHGIFEIAEAKRQKLEQEIGVNIKIGQSISSSDNWLALPSAMGETRDDMPQADRSLLVFYYDLADNRVPSRYDDYLPMPSEEIAAVLERGEGLVVARKRANGKPTIVIAAPRPAQLEAVEEAFSKMTEVPFTPVTVPLQGNLLPGEIQAVVRSSRAHLRGCYEAALERNKSLQGKLTLAFGIDGDGRVTSPAVEIEPSLAEQGLEACLLQDLEKMRFPATGKTTTVKYPIVMTP